MPCILRFWSSLVALACVLPGGRVSAQTVVPTEIVRIASGLENPRGVVVLPDGRLLVAEAGRGDDIPGRAVGSGRISLLADLNGDGDYDDPGERTPILTRIASYNSLVHFGGTGHDEVFGLGDLLVMDDGRIFFTRDDPFAVARRNEEGMFEGDTGIFLVNADSDGFTRFARNNATLNAIVHDPQRGQFYVAASGQNRLMALSLAGELSDVAEFDLLASGQQGVPAGLAFDARTGDVLVALLSGYIYDFYYNGLSYMPGDARVMRVNPDTGQVTTLITDLTMAVDVAIDPAGNVYVVEMTRGWPVALMPLDFDLNDPSLPPDPGGYARVSGRVTLVTPDGLRFILADGLDTPTNITYHEGYLYVSTGLGTPGRRVMTPDGTIMPIEGVLVRIRVPGHRAGDR